jgi:N6-adenosine-specific RNA methylase IME4
MSEKLDALQGLQHAGSEIVLAVDLERITVGKGRRKANAKKVQELAASIFEVGLLNPIVIDRDFKLIAGLHRLEAFRQMNLPQIRAIVKEGLDANKAELAEIDENLIRNELSEAEQIQALKRREEILSAAGEWRGRGGNGSNQHRSKSPDSGDLHRTGTRNLAEAMGVAPSTLREKLAIAKDLEEEALQAATGSPVELTQGQLKQISKLSPEKQRAIAALLESGDPEQIKAALVELVGERKVVEASKAIRQERNETRRQERLDKIAEISQGNTGLESLGGKRFPVIYADPPWKYEHVETESRAIENQYPTMELDDICALPVTEIATEDAILFMWATSPKLEESFKVLNAWGFTYRTCMIWDKATIGMGYYARQQHELLLICTRGSIPVPAPENRPPSVYREPKSAHSSKPAYFYTMIEGMYPELSKVELFCRSPQEGWMAWGNQT